ncbi:MAG TPA: hypothetical protein VKY36_04240 [Moheibacter sp.]|nr:hypothetical protein [Moheibacter sp.]
MMKKWGICLLAAGLFLGACKNDDDNNEISQEDQNQVDDEAIVMYLQDHYFEPERGLIKKYDEDDESDDEYPNLHSMGTKLNSGVWIIKRPGIIAEGPAADNNTQDSILISLHSQSFVATNEDLAEGQKPYQVGLSTFESTINGNGTAKWDPNFYYARITPDMEENDIDLSNFVIEGFTEGLKEFKSTQTSGSDLYNFQGAIIVPSRAAFARDFVYTNAGMDNRSFRNRSFIFNFELHKVIPRNN